MMGLVTLILGMSTPNGICMSVDYRVTRSDTGAEVDPYASKSLVVNYRPFPGGPVALFGYTGLAQLWGGMPTGRWLREVLRGGGEDFNQSMQHLKQQLNSRVARSYPGVELTILVMVAAGSKERHIGGFTNRDEQGNVQPQFRYEMCPLGPDTGKTFSGGSGRAVVLGDGHASAMTAHAADPTNFSDESMPFLANINRQVAEKDSGVSPYSYVTYIGSDTDWKARCGGFNEAGENVPFIHPMMILGIDLTEMSETMMRSMGPDGLTDLPDLEDMARRAVKRRP